MFFFSFFCFFLLTPSIVLPGMASYGSNAGQKQAERGKRDTEREKEKKRTLFSSFVLFLFLFFLLPPFFSFLLFFSPYSLSSSTRHGVLRLPCRTKEAEEGKRDIEREKKFFLNTFPFLTPIFFIFFFYLLFFSFPLFISPYSVPSSTRHGILRLPCWTKRGRKREKGHREREKK